jgi:hypothetical protein
LLQGSNPEQSIPLRAAKAASYMYDGYWGIFLRVLAAWALPPSSIRGYENVELYLHLPPRKGTNLPSDSVYSS